MVGYEQSWYIVTMTTYTGLLLLALIGFVQSQDYARYPSKPCAINDTSCVFEAMSGFFKTQCNGIPEYDIRQIDPLTIPSLDIENEDGSIVYHLSNINVEGLKDQRMTSLDWDRELRHCCMKFSVENLNIVADIDIEFVNLCRTYSGLYTATTAVLGTMHNDYSIVQCDDEDHFELGPDTYECDIVENPDVWLTDDLQDELDNDPDTSCLKEDYQSDLSSVVLRTIVETAHSTIVHNIRTMVKLLPSSHFFEGL